MPDQGPSATAYFACHDSIPWQQHLVLMVAERCFSGNNTYEQWMTDGS